MFAGLPTSELRERLIAALDRNELFIAEQVRIPERFFDTWPGYVDDHCWHEFDSLESTDRAADDKYERTIEQFVREVEQARAAGWKAFDPDERMRAAGNPQNVIRDGGAGSTRMHRGVVHTDPDIMSGEPVFVGTRVPVRNLFDFLEEGDSLDEFLDEFPSVSREQAIAALEICREALEAVAHSRR